MKWIGSVSCTAAALFAAAAAPPAGLPFQVGGDEGALVAWGQRIASANDDWINDLVMLRNGNLIAVGFLNRIDASPPSDWSALAAEIGVDGTFVEHRSFGTGGGIDAFWSVAETDDGSRMFAGFTTRIGGGGIDGMALLAGPKGDMRFERGFGQGGYDRFTDVTAAAGGHVFLGHSQAAGSDKRRIFIVKTDFSGETLWERVHDAPESWGALYIEPSGDGGFIVAGGTAVAGNGDMFAMKLDAEGRELWRKRAGTPDWDEVNHGLVVRSDGRILLTGYTHKRGADSNDLVAATLSASGEVERVERLGGSGDDRAILAKADGLGRIWIVGHSGSAGAGGQDLLLARLDSQGRFESSAITIGGPADDHGTALLPLDDGSIMLAGYSRGLGGGGEDAFVLRLARPAWDRPNPAFKREVALEP